MMHGKRLSAVASILALSASVAFAADSGSTERHLAKVKKLPNGTVSLKQVAGYNDYQSDKEFHAQLKDLKDPVAIWNLKAKHGQLNVLQQSNGGLLGGAVEIGTSVVTFTLTGTQEYSGITHVISLPANFEVDSAPRHPGAEIDTFATNMVRIEGATTAADDVFEYVRLVGGTANGYDSPGQMSLIDKGDSVLVDSFFNVGFRLEIKGAKGGPLDGIEDSVEGKVTMRSGAASQPAATRVKPVKK